MFFNVQAHNERIAVFKDTMSRIESDSRLQQAVLSSIASQVFYPEGQPIALPTPPYTEPAQVIVTKNRSFEAARPYDFHYRIIKHLKKLRNNDRL